METSSLPDPKPNPVRILGDRYEIIRKLAEGGMAIVYLAHDLLLEREVVVKMLRPELLADSAHVERFRREGVALAAIRSPHVVCLHDIGFGPSELYLVQRRLRGRTLDELVRHGGAVPPARALALIDQVLAGLSALHDHRMVHRDLTPLNVIVTWDDEVVLIDLGVVLDRRMPPLTPVAYVAGTPAFMSPEQIGSHEVDERSDLHQAARLLHYLLTARSELDDLAGVPGVLRPILERALSDRPRDRFHHSAALRLELANALASLEDDREVETRVTERLEAFAVIELTDRIERVELADILETVDLAAAPTRPRRRRGAVAAMLAVAALAMTYLAVADAGDPRAARARAASPPADVLAPPAPPPVVPTLVVAETASPVEAVTVDVEPPGDRHARALPRGRRSRAPVAAASEVPAPAAIVRSPALTTAIELDRLGSDQAALGAYRSCLNAATPSEGAWIEARIAELSR